MSQPPGQSSIRLVPLGGLGEIGMNCLAIEQDDQILVVDCGIQFPQDDLGVDVIHPDFTWLIDRADRIAGVFLTHAHEDHIGGLPYLLAEVDVPIWGSPYALALVRRRLSEHDFKPHEIRLRPAAPGQTYQVGPFEIEPVRVSHSIPESSALRIETAVGTVLHTGDFNFDADPPDGEPTDEARLRAIGDAGVALMLSDSTNIGVPTRDHGEREVGAELERLIRAAPERVFVSMFASNVHRLQMLGEIAERVGRKLCLLGRSMNNHREVAHEIGRLSWPSHLTLAPEQARDFPRSELLVLAGGSQAERNSAMARLAADSHNYLVIEQGDTAILSARIIPGNERGVFDLMGDLLRKGADLHTRVTNPLAHTSGHAVRAEQAHMIELVRPRAFVPAHGTLHHLTRHAQLAREQGVPQVLTVENGTPIRFDGEQLRSAPPVHHGKIHIANGGEPIERETLLRRAELARTGVVAVAIVVDEDDEFLSEPEVTAFGVPALDDEAARLRDVARDVARAFSRARCAATDPAMVDEIRRAVRRSVYDLCGARPVVQVQVTVTDDE